jgi:hypothetical protein
MYAGSLKVDLVIQLLFINTFCFLCVLFTNANELEDLPYWIILGVTGVLVLGNNIHGHYTMKTTASSINTKVYFVTRFFVQILETYLAITFAFNCDLLFNEKLVLPEQEYDEVRRLQVACDVMAVISLAIFIGLILSAIRLLKVKQRTEGDEIRLGADS